MTTSEVYTASIFFNDTATTEIYTLSLHDALPISGGRCRSTRPCGASGRRRHRREGTTRTGRRARGGRSEEHTSELQSRQYLVCRLLLEKKKTTHYLLCRHQHEQTYTRTAYQTPIV